MDVGAGCCVLEGEGALAQKLVPAAAGLEAEAGAVETRGADAAGRVEMAKVLDV